MWSGRIVRFLAVAAAALSLAGCRAFCERNYPPQTYAPNCGCYAPQQPCCAPASNYPIQPCAPAQPVWTPQHP